MKLIAIATSILVSALTSSGAAQTARPQVMVVGTYHMANPGQDFANIVADDVLAPKRQAEIERLVQLLAAFRPTVVALEYTSERDSLMNARYQAFRAGKYTPARNESEQVGFRLASALGLPLVHGIDYRRDLDVSAVMGFAVANGFQQFAGATQSGMQRMIGEVQRQFSTMTVPQILAEHNGQMMESLESFYLQAAKIGKDTNYVGAKMASDWYARNMYIFANISRIVAQPDERVLVLVGAGHAGILRSLIRGAREWESVDPVPFLRK